MAQPTRQSGDRPVTAVTSAGARWTHILGDGRTVCGYPINDDTWTVRAQGHVHDVDWCDRCWDRYFT